MTPTGVGTRPLPTLDTSALTIAIVKLLEDLYLDIVLPDAPISRKHVSKAERNAQIILRYMNGHTLEEIAQEFGISVQRTHQIVSKSA